ncbi:hypothetical protein Tco_0706800 [Tanacetum coccineum]|uniref:Uncharacterized protein n=1 Tax=Tanacetum coccineum TaxID=301880 RepID=A0ABQ4Y8F0_9ASTR
MRVVSPPLLLLSTSHRTDIPEAPRKRACFTTPAPRFEVGESSVAGAARQPRPTLEADLRRDRVREMGYGITDTWDEIVEAMLEIAPNTLYRRFHRHTAMLLDREATYARRAWTIEARDPEPQDEPADAGNSC